MSTRDWKFHDYTMRVANAGPFTIGETRCDHYYFLTNLSRGSQCYVYPADGGYWRRTRNGGMNGSVRYQWYKTLDDALTGGVMWARRKDEEAARKARAAADVS